MDDYEPPERVYGVDFSADRERAGRNIWVAEAVVDDGLRVIGCAPLVDRLGAGRERAAALPALTRFLGGLDGAAVGLDFPFGLPDEVVAAEEWTEVLRRLPGWADDPADLARQCADRASLEGDDAELVRDTEEPLGAMSPYNSRLCDLTFYGLRDVLRPLVLADAARAVPMQPPAGGRPTLMEVYPAGTFERLGGHEVRYRGDGEDARQRRAENLDRLLETGATLADGVRETVLDGGGDALDAVVAAVAAHHHARDPADLRTGDADRRLEGHVYV